MSNHTWTPRAPSLRSIAGIACAVVFPVCLACGPAPVPEVPESVRLGYQQTLVTLDPHAHNDGITAAVLGAVYEALVTVEPGATIRPVLAKRWITPDERTWRFEIRQGIHFHNGEALTVADVVWSIRRARFDSDSALANLLAGIEEVRTLEDDSHWSIEITTDAPFPLLLSRLAMVAVVPQDFDPVRPVGTGPYRWVSGSLESRITIERWPRFWGEEPTIRTVTIDFLPTDEELSAAMLRGELDVVGKAGLDYLLRFDLDEAPGDWHMVSNPAATTSMIALNTGIPPLDDLRVRTAIDLALDREHLVATGLPRGSASPAKGLVPEEVFGASPSPPRRGADLGRAAALMAEVGVPPGTVIHLQHSRVSPGLVELIAETFRSLDLVVEVEDIPYEDFYVMIGSGGLEAFIFGWNFVFGDPSDFLESMAHARQPERQLGRLNGTGLADPLLDRLIEDAGHQSSPGLRLNDLRSALARVEEAKVYLPIYHSARQALFRSPFTMVRRSGSWLRPQEIVAEARRPVRRSP